MVHIIRGDEKTGFTLAPANTDEEIMQNVRLLLSTKKYDIPLAREMGLSSSALSRPIPIAETLLTQEITDVIERYEPRAKVVSIDFEENHDTGQLIPIVEVKTDG